MVVYRYNKVKKEVDYERMDIVLIIGFDKGVVVMIEYLVVEIKGMFENMGLVVKNGRYFNEIIWSEDGEWLFLKLKKYNIVGEKKEK